jgi:serine/threonine-protein kinase
VGKRVGRFRLISLLGTGAMGRVFRAEDTLLHRQVALKVLPKVLKRGGRTIAVDRLIREARAAATLDHPHVVTVYEVNESNGVYYIAMEMLEGGSLRDLVKGAGALEYSRACMLAADTAEALAHAHATGVVHRDVKPANLMLTRNGRCKVADFGLARVDDANDLSSVFGESVGTPQFVAPEILRGQPASSQSDVYSLGGTLWFLLTGRPVFESNTASELLSKHLEAPVPDLSALRPDLPPGLVQAVYKSLAKRPCDRFDSAAQFEKVLRVYTIPVESSGAIPSLSSLEVGPVEPVRLPVLSAPGRRLRWPLIGGAAAAAVILTAALIPGITHLRARSNAVSDVPAGPVQNTSTITPKVDAQPAAASHAPDDVAPSGAAPAPHVAPAVAAIHRAEKAVNVIDKLDLNAASVKGAWRYEFGDLVSDNSGPAILELPVAVPAEYDFRMEFTPEDCVEQLLFKPAPDPERRDGVAFNWCMNVGELSGFESVEGRHVFDTSSPVTRRYTVKPGARHTSLVRVRKDRVQAFVDGQLVVEHKTDYHDLSRQDDWSFRNNDKLGLGTWNKPTRFHKVELIDKTGAKD